MFKNNIKKSILVIENLHSQFIVFLKKHFLVNYFPYPIDHEKLLQYIPYYDILIIRGKTIIHDPHFFKKAIKLKLIIRAGSGIDNINTELARKHQITIKNITSANSNAVSEFVIGLMINLTRNISFANQTMLKNQWIRADLRGKELAKKKLVLIGFGNIGQQVAQKAHIFGMNIFFYDPFIIHTPFFYAKKIKNFYSVLKLGDFVSLHCPSTPENKDLISFKAFSSMKKTAFFINTARGNIVNEEALIQAIENHKIQGAALDVFPEEPFIHPQHPLKKYPHKIILTPHIAGQSKEAEINILKEIKLILLRFIK